MIGAFLARRPRGTHLRCDRDRQIAFRDASYTGPRTFAGIGYDPNTDERIRVRLCVAGDGAPSIELLDADGHVTWSVR
jgi:hypothetical protein